MVLKCIFSSPYGMKRRLIEGLKKMPPLTEGVVQKGFYTSDMDKEGRTSITILYEFEESRLMEVSRKIFGQKDAFSGVTGLGFSAQLWTDTNKALNSIPGKS